jgi:hypothetical protein
LATKKVKQQFTSVFFFLTASAFSFQAEKVTGSGFPGTLVLFFVTLQNV